ncbi:MAG TPA: class I SAM-dependent methyltransferase [Thermoanaerobaculia bacterium]|nr:class I SAM-dependent methyltransferase [Thermoanaerobaculia bacterium]
MAPAWLLERLRCPRCDRPSLRPDEGDLACDCGGRYRVDRGVVDCLDPERLEVRGGVHRAVLDERAAVASIDRGEVSIEEGDAAAARQRHLRRTRSALEEVLPRLEPLDGAVAVELGADDCWASPLLLERGCRVVAVDITEHLQLAASDLLEHPDHARLRADMNRLPILDGGVDLVVAIAAAHHSWSLAQTFSEAHRVLRPGGRIALCCEPLPSWLRFLLGRRSGDAERRLGINEGWIRRGRWLRLGRRAGFEVELSFPSLDREAIRERLAERRLPTLLAPTARAALRILQVSGHVLGRRR